MQCKTYSRSEIQASTNNDSICSDGQITRFANVKHLQPNTCCQHLQVTKRASATSANRRHHQSCKAYPQFSPALPHHSAASAAAGTPSSSPAPQPHSTIGWQHHAEAAALWCMQPLRWPLHAHRPNSTACLTACTVGYAAHKATAAQGLLTAHFDGKVGWAVFAKSVYANVENDSRFQ
jgi:hypothetical protein